MGYRSRLGLGRFRSKSLRKIGLKSSPSSASVQPSYSGVSHCNDDAKVTKNGIPTPASFNDRSTKTSNTSDTLATSATHGTHSTAAPIVVAMPADRPVPRRTPAYVPLPPSTRRGVSANTDVSQPTPSVTVSDATILREKRSTDSSTIQSKSYHRPCSSLDSVEKPEDPSPNTSKHLQTVITIPGREQTASSLQTRTRSAGQSSQTTGSSRSSRSSRSSESSRSSLTDSQKTQRVQLELAEDMLFIANGFNLDLNTQYLLAQYDARTLEDFSLMTPTDLQGLVVGARKKGQPIPPLQVRKIHVLREWVQELSAMHSEALREAHVYCDRVDEDEDEDEDEDSGNGGGDAGINHANNHRHIDRLSHGAIVNDDGITAQRSGDMNVTTVQDESVGDTLIKTSTLIPSDWKRKFRRDLPYLKDQLRQRGDDSATAATGVSWVDNIVVPLIQDGFHAFPLSAFLSCSD